MADDWDAAPPTRAYGSPRSGETEIKPGEAESPHQATPKADDLFIPQVPERPPQAPEPTANERLANERPAPQKQTAGKSSSRMGELSLDLDLRMVGLAVVALICVAFIWSEDLVSGSVDSSPTNEKTKQTSPASAEDSLERSARICASTMTRVFQGGSVSIADVDGWVVEIAFLKVGGKESLAQHPILQEFVAKPRAKKGSRFIWKHEPQLVPLETSDTVVRVRDTTIGEKDDSIPGVTLTFGGTLVDAYFKEEGRPSYYHIANSLSDTMGATHTAIYAKCDGGDTHALGGWYRGPDASSAAAALVYFMGTFAKPIHLAKPYYQLPGEESLNRTHTWASVYEKTKPITRADLATLVGKEGGMASGKKGDKVIITFPFRDGNRASRASRNIVRVTSLGL